jgi:hypothetical protein
MHGQQRYIFGVSAYIQMGLFYDLRLYDLSLTKIHVRIGISNEMQLYYLGFIWRSVHISGIHRAHHQEYITASAVVGITYERWIVKCMVASAFKVVQNGWWSHH